MAERTSVKTVATGIVAHEFQPIEFSSSFRWSSLA
jgi:hypothetical protein